MSADIGERLLRWKSGPVLRDYPGYFLVPARDIDEAAAEIVRLRGEACSCPSGDGSLRWPCKAHPPGAIAPAEAKGCSCPRGASTMFTLTDTACPQHGTPQPAAQVQGEAVDTLALRMLVAAGHVSQKLMDQSRSIARGVLPGPLDEATPPAGDALGAVRDGYYLASFKHKANNGEVMWWKCDNAGYSPDLAQAGIYTELVPGYHDSEHTVPVPVAFLAGLRIRRTVDPGDSLNHMFWSAERLRAALQHRGDSRGGEGS